MRKLFIIVVCICMLGGCSSVGVQGTQVENMPEQETQPENALTQKLDTLSFETVSDYYSRNVVQDGVEITEMFVIEEKRFVRIALGDDEEEVFAYNYASDEFTYLYFLADELVVKVVYNIGDDKVIEDEDDFIDLVKIEAIELKEYFTSLIETADISVEELLKGGEIL
ncbi:MAG: hypothetical protein HN948_05980 [Clostridia bacterium]|jgi:hypothetical protein|nr:hypothetical protein [Clostridia bacterium]MBT7122544.1 hypothetical protein [Clostridia bacterium]